MAAELGTMSVNDQIVATKTLGVDPIEFLVVPRMLACFLVLPGLVVFSEIVGIFGGYAVGILDAGIPSATYIQQTIKAVKRNVKSLSDAYGINVKVLFQVNGGKVVMLAI